MSLCFGAALIGVALFESLRDDRLFDELVAQRRTAAREQLQRVAVEILPGRRDG
jgi:hypothetical protein